VEIKGNKKEIKGSKFTSVYAHIVSVCFRELARRLSKLKAIYPAVSLSRAAAASGVRSRCGEPSISKPTMNFLIVAERSSGG